MDFTINGAVRFRSERGSFRIDAVLANGAEFGVLINSPQLGTPFRNLEEMARKHSEPAVTPEIVEEISQEDRGWVRRMYDLTTDFHKKTGIKVSMVDLLEAFFAETIKQVDEDDREAFERRLRVRLQEQAPGWDQ